MGLNVVREICMRIPLVSLFSDAPVLPTCILRLTVCFFYYCDLSIGPFLNCVFFYNCDLCIGPF